MKAIALLILGFTFSAHAAKSVLYQGKQEMYTCEKSAKNDLPYTSAYFEVLGKETALITFMIDQTKAAAGNCRTITKKAYWCQVGDFHADETLIIDIEVLEDGFSFVGKTDKRYAFGCAL